MKQDEEIKEIFEQALKDPSLLSEINIEKLLESVDDDKNNYLEDKTMNTINNEIYETINVLNINIEEKKKICDKLIGYRFVENLNELHKGKHVRWIRKSTNKLTNGGIIVDIKFLNNGIQILCKNSMNRFIQYKYDECITYQKMNEAEQLVVMAYEYASNAN